MKQLIVRAIKFLVPAFCSCIVILLSLNTFDYKLESQVKKCIEPHVLYEKNGMSKTVFRIASSSDKQTRYQDLYQTYYWSSLSNGCRELINDYCSVVDLSKNITIATQSIFSLEQNKYSGQYYYLHDGQYFTYFGKDTCSPNRLLPDCKSFIFVSDNLADEILISKGYNIPTIESEKKDLYLKLITDNLINTIRIDIPGLGEIKFCINNVINTKFRQGIHMSYIHKNFSLAYLNSKLFKDVKFCFEFEFKNSVYASKTVLKAIIEKYKNDGEKTIGFYSNKDNEFVENHEFNEAFDKIRKMYNSNTVIIIVLPLVILFYFTYEILNKIFLRKKGGINKIDSLLSIAVFLIYLVFASCFGFYYLWNVIPVFSVVSNAIYLLPLKRMFRLNKEYKEKNENINFYEINL